MNWQALHLDAAVSGVKNNQQSIGSVVSRAVNAAEFTFQNLLIIDEN